MSHALPQHSAAYTAILVNNDQQRGQLQCYESYLPVGQPPALTIERGDTQVQSCGGPLPDRTAASSSVTIQLAPAVSPGTVLQDEQHTLQ
jgi:hypothetical protein